MATEIRNLWPELSPLSEPPPVFVLREQAAQLGKRTNTLVVAEVTTQAVGENFAHTFILVAPALDNYRYVLFQAVHGVALYPVNIGFQGRGFKANTLDELYDLLATIFKDEQTQRVLRSLLTQSQSLV